MTNKEAIEILKGIYPYGTYSKTEGQHLKAINMAIAALANTQRMTEALRTEYEKGRYDMREEMTKEAIDGIVEWSLDSDGCYLQAGSLRLKYEKSPYGNPREGDKVKLLIIKEN